MYITPVPGRTHSSHIPAAMKFVLFVHVSLRNTADIDAYGTEAGSKDVLAASDA